MFTKKKRKNIFIYMNIWLYTATAYEEKTVVNVHVSKVKSQNSIGTESSLTSTLVCPVSSYGQSPTKDPRIIRSTQAQKESKKAALHFA